MTTKFMAKQKHNPESKVGGYIEDDKDPELNKTRNINLSY